MNLSDSMGVEEAVYELLDEMKYLNPDFAEKVLEKALQVQTHAKRKYRISLEDVA